MMDTQVPGFEVTAVCALPLECALRSVTLDGHAMAIVTTPDGRFRFLWDGEPGSSFDRMGEKRDKTPAIFTSADGAHIAYMAGRGERHFVGRDGEEGPEFDDLTRSVPPVFSADGRHLAYGAGGHDNLRLVLDGTPVSVMPVAPIQAVFSPDGSRLAYVEMQPTVKEEYEVRVVLDGAPGPWFPGMRNETGVMQFSPDGQRFACRQSFHGGMARWVVDGVAQQEAHDVVSLRQAFQRVSVVEGPVAAVFSPDSRRFAYFADVIDKGVAIIEDDVPGPVVKAVSWPVFSPGSDHLAYLAYQFDGRLALVLDGAPGPSWPAVDGGGPWFSGDGRHVAILLKREEGSLFRKRHVYTLVIDGRAITEVEGSDVSAHPAFSPDGAHFAWWVQRGKDFFPMVDDRPVDADGGVESDLIYTPSSRLVCAGKMPSGAVSVLVDGRAGALAAGICMPGDILWLFGGSLDRRPPVPFAVSPDGEHVAWSGVIDGRPHPILDDRVGPEFDLALSVAFDAGGRATWMAQRADVVYRITAEPQVADSAAPGAG